MRKAPIGGRGFGKSPLQRAAFIDTNKINEFKQFVKTTTGYAPGEKKLSFLQNLLVKSAIWQKWLGPEWLRPLFWGRVGPAFIHGYTVESRILLLDLMEKFKILKPQSTRNIVSMYSAQGLLELYLGRKFPGCEITAVDFAGRAIRLGRAYAKKLRIENVKFVKADARDTKLPSNKYDIAVIAFAAPDVELVKTLKEAKRLLDNKKTTHLVIARPVNAKLTGPLMALGLSHLASQIGFVKVFSATMFLYEQPNKDITFAIFKLGARSA